MTTTAESQPYLHQVAESATCSRNIGGKLLTQQPGADSRPMFDIIDVCGIRQRRRSDADRWPKVVDVVYVCDVVVVVVAVVVAVVSVVCVM